MEWCVDVYLGKRQVCLTKSSLKRSNLIVIYETCNADDQRKPSDSLLTTIPLQLVADVFFYPPTI